MLLLCKKRLPADPEIKGEWVERTQRNGDGFEVPELGDEWKMGCPKSPKWESEGEAWSEDEGAQ